MAQTAALRSTCARGNNGAVIVQNKRIISIGYNGPESGAPHCTGRSCERTYSGGCFRSIHAEINAIGRAEPSAVRGSIMYCTTSPCLGCVRSILEAGVVEVFYSTAYRDTKPIVDLMQHGVDVYRITPAGHVVNEATQELMPDDFE